MIGAVGAADLVSLFSLALALLLLWRGWHRQLGDDAMLSLAGEAAVETYREGLEAGQPPSLVVMDLNLSGSNADEDIVYRHREGEDEKMDGVRTAMAIYAVDGSAVIWGYTAWADTPWADRLDDVGAHKIIDRIVPFKAFAEMVAGHLRG
ncbi:MAG: hypothetical protein R6U10_01600 [Thermoplasmatota archaeon]